VPLEPLLDHRLRVGAQEHLELYRQRLSGRASMIHGYATGRRFNVAERILFSGAAYAETVATAFGRFGTRSAGLEILRPALARALVVHARRRLLPPFARRPSGASLG
jgi:hypothetical protein